MKRFTDTDKWRDPWFRRLSADAKLAYLYLMDNVDNAGVWQVDIELANFQLHKKIDWESARIELGDRVQVFAGKCKWLLTRFIGFQYGDLKDECRPHLQINRLIELHGIKRVCKGYGKGIYTVQDSTGQDSTGLDQGGAGGVPAETPEPPLPLIEEPPLDNVSPLAIYSAYPRKVGRNAALKAIVKAIESGESPSALLSATKAFAEATSKWPRGDEQWIPHPATWFTRGSYHDDPAVWRRTPGIDKAQPQPTRRYPVESQIRTSARVDEPLYQ